MKGINKTVKELNMLSKEIKMEIICLNNYFEGHLKKEHLKEIESCFNNMVMIGRSSGLKQGKEIRTEQIERIIDKELLERLADLEHQQWRHLIKWLKNYKNTFNEQDPRAYLECWKVTRLLEKDYRDLSEEDKEKDRIWAKKVVKEIKLQINKIKKDKRL